MCDYCTNVLVNRLKQISWKGTVFSSFVFILIINRSSKLLLEANSNELQIKLYFQVVNGCKSK